MEHSLRYDILLPGIPDEEARILLDNDIRAAVAARLGTVAIVDRAEVASEGSELMDPRIQAVLDSPFEEHFEKWLTTEDCTPNMKTSLILSLRKLHFGRLRDLHLAGSWLVMRNFGNGKRAIVSKVLAEALPQMPPFPQDPTPEFAASFCADLSQITLGNVPGIFANGETWDHKHQAKEGVAVHLNLAQFKQMHIGAAAKPHKLAWVQQAAVEYIDRFEGAKRRAYIERQAARKNGI